MSATQPLARDPGAVNEPASTAGFAVRLALTVTLAVAAFLLLCSAVLLIAQPQLGGLGRFARSVNQQNQGAKTAIYAASFLVILPLALITATRVADRVTAGPNADTLSVLAALLASSLLALLIAVRLSHRLPWGDGLRTVLVVTAVWSLAAAAALARAARARAWHLLDRLARHEHILWTAAALLVLGVLLCVTRWRGISVLALLLGAVLSVATVIAAGRARLPKFGGWSGRTVDLAVVILLFLAVPDVVLFKASGSIPNIYAGPGIIQYQHDYLLGSVNQLLGGGALLVGVPVSQYGVGALYFIAGWFHLAPIGYGTFAALDSLLTALFYVAAYACLRIAGVGRLLAASALLVAVLSFVYDLHYPVGALPEQGPLRFGLPMVVVFAALIAQRWPRHASVARVAGLIALAISSVWALEAFAYTTLTWVAVTAAEAWLSTGQPRARWFWRRVLIGLLACVAAHVLFALLTLLGSGHLPDWGQYLAYSRAFLLGGAAGAISYGFAHWSPGLVFAAAALASAAGVILLVIRMPELARRQRVTLIGLTGATAYAVALLSYTDNRSSTYLLPYVALPLLMAAVLWLALLLRSHATASTFARRGGLAFALSVAVLMVAVAWPQIGGRFDNTALAHAYPGGGLTAALHRLWHLPPIDPRAPEGERLLNRYMPGRRALILLPTVPDLGTEILIRGRKSNTMFIGDPKADSLVSSVWIPKLTQQVAQLHAGQRLLVDRNALAMLPALRALTPAQIVAYPIRGGWQEIEWLLRAIDQRFEIVPLYRAPDGLIAAQLRAG